MERQQQMQIDKQEKNHNEEHKKDIAQLINPSSSPPPSPSHEFSFTISLHPSAAAKAPEKSKSPPPFAIDLSPADEIFFHGHLLPLHLLSHLSTVSPRSSTNSLDSFTLPIKELPSQESDDHPRQESSLLEGKGEGKRKWKSFSLFGWRKGEKHHQKRKSKFELNHFVKRYMRLVKPFVSLIRNRRENPQIHRRQPYSFSGNLEMRSKRDFRERREEFSAPASMKTSPTNSGLLVASGSLTPTTSSDSTMEELQAAIQAAIAHCKKSIATEDKIKLP